MRVACNFSSLLLEPVHLDGFESLSRKDISRSGAFFIIWRGHGSGDRSHSVGGSLFWSRLSEHSVHAT